MLGFDCDGVILNYSGHTSLLETRVNPNLASLLPRDDRQVAILTNQGGMALNDLDPARYPAPSTVMRRIAIAAKYLTELGYSVEFVAVSAFHHKAAPEAIQSAASVVRRYLKNTQWIRDATVYTTARARKPSPFMLVQAGVAVYYGDSPEDEAAAATAGVPFVLVPRFM